MSVVDRRTALTCIRLYYFGTGAFKDVNSTGPNLRKMQRRYTASCWIVIISQKCFEKLSRTCFGEEVPRLLDPSYEGKRIRTPPLNKLPCPKVQISLRPSRDHIHFSGRSCPSEWCNNGEAVVISGRAGSIKLPLRAA